jgi:hypothetical protein
LSYVIPILNEEGAAYYWRLERLAELVLRAVAVRNQKEPNKAIKKKEIADFILEYPLNEEDEPED